MGGGIRAVLTRKSIILYHSWSAPAFSCSVVTACRWPISLTQAWYQFTFPCSSSSMFSSGNIGMGPGTGGGIPSIKLGSNLPRNVRSCTERAIALRTGEEDKPEGKVIVVAGWHLHLAKHIGH